MAGIIITKPGITTLQSSKLASIETGATTDQTDAEIQTALENQIGTAYNTGYRRRDSAAGFTRASNSTFVITDNAVNQAIFRPGLPIAYRTTAESGDFSYGIIKNYSSGTVTILGPALPDPLGELQVGRENMVEQVTINVQGTLSIGDDQLDAVMDTEFRWGKLLAYCVAARAQVANAATDADLHVAIGIGVAANDLLNSPVYINLAQSTTAIDSEVNINTSNYDIAYDEKVFINIDQVGSTLPGNHLTVRLTFVFPVRS